MEKNQDQMPQEEPQAARNARAAFHTTLAAAEALNLDTNKIRTGYALISLEDCLNGLQGHLFSQQLGTPLTTEDNAKDEFRQSLQVDVEQGHLPENIREQLEEIKSEIINTPLATADITLEAMRRYRNKIREIMDAAQKDPRLGEAIDYYAANAIAIGKKQTDLINQKKSDSSE